MEGPARPWGAFNEDRFAHDVADPLAGGATTLAYQPYDFELGALAPVEPLQVDSGVIVERCVSFGLAIDWDLRLWVETPRDVCLSRGLARDLVPADRLRTVWADIWQPAEDQYLDTVDPVGLADIVLDGTRPLDERVV